MSEELKTLASPGRLLEPPDVPLLETCLSDDELLNFVQGRMNARRLASMHAHVDACEVCQRLVVEAAHSLDEEPISESTRPSWNTVFQPNMTIGKRYRVLRLVARGGMGEVYEAFDTALHERVALKTVTSTACDNLQAVRYLKAEVQLARRIGHPNVCRIYDFGTHVMETSRNEIHFLVMEFVEGESLGRKLRQDGALPLDLANSIARQLLFGLRAAHQAGILHRDFKSDNVMLRNESNGRVTPIILDFGLARALNESGSIATTRGQGQAMVGTIGYMAPEQIEGEPLSTASDIYAFGVVWFEMLTGRLPFEGVSPVASAMARLHREPMAPSTANPNVPTWLDNIVLRCLNRHRRNRFANAEQVLESMDAASTSRKERARRPHSIRRKLVVLGASLGIATIAASISRPTANHRAAAVAMPRMDLETTIASARAVPIADITVAPVVATAEASARPSEVPGTPAKRRTRSARQPTLANTTVPAPIPQQLPQLATVGDRAPATPAPAAPAASAVVKAPDWLPLWSKPGSNKAAAVVD